MQQILKKNEIIMKKERFGNLDILRTLCSIFVVYNHFCTDHKALEYIECIYPQFIFFYRLIYSCTVLAVPLFFLMSGYLSINSEKQKLGKFISLFFMAEIYSEIQTICSQILLVQTSGGDFSFSLCVKKLLLQNYYVYLFCAVYAVSPFLNRMVKNLSKKEFSNLLIVLFCLYSVWSTIINLVTTFMGSDGFTGAYFTNMDSTTRGFNVANFLVLYLIGGYVRLYYDKTIKRGRVVLNSAFLAGIVLMTVCSVVNLNFSMVLYYYDSVFVIILSVILFLLFLSININENNVFKFLGTGAFGVFLLHGFVTQCLEQFISIEQLIVSKKIFWAMVIFVFGVWLISLILTKVLEYIAKPLSKWWKNTKIYNILFIGKASLNCK